MALLVTKDNLKKNDKKDGFHFKSFKNVIVFLIMLFIIYLSIEIVGLSYNFGTHVDILILLLALIGTYMYNKYSFIKSIRKGRDIKKIESNDEDSILSALSILKDSTYVLKNVSVKGKRGIINIGLAVINENGLVIIKNDKLKGKISGKLKDDKLIEIINNRERSIENPFIKMNTKKEDIKAVLLEKNHEINIYNVLLVKDNAEISIEDSYENKVLNKNEDLISYINSLKHNKKNKIKFDEVLEIIEELV